MNEQANSVSSNLVQGLMQAHETIAYTANRLYDGQLDIAREAQSQLRKAQQKIDGMEVAMLYANEQLRLIDEEHMTKTNQVHLDRALDHIYDYLPTTLPF